MTIRFLPPPAASTVYHLTDAGNELADVLSAVARWGSTTLGPPQEGQSIVVEGIAFMVMGVFRRAHYPALILTCDFEVRDAEFNRHFGVYLSAQGVRMTDELITPADTHVQLGLEMLSALSSGRVTLQELIKNAQVTIAGERNAVTTLLKWVDGE